MTTRRRRIMTAREQRLVAVLIVLRDELAPVIDQITVGAFTPDDGLKLAAIFELIARDLRPTTIPSDDAGDAGGR